MMNFLKMAFDAAQEHAENADTQAAQEPTDNQMLAAKIVLGAAGAAVVGAAVYGAYRGVDYMMNKDKDAKKPEAKKEEAKK
jgi:hypothetical protein